MYSLYRAWLSLGPTALPSLTTSDLHSSPGFPYGPQHTNGAPDVTLQIGPGLTHFSAHKNILAANSGFFKAVFLNHTGSNPITVPNINVDEFSSLLTFMYTGFLDLNYANIYNILLATHILHMPRALEICRSFLIQNHPLELRPTATTTTSVIKPIPSRKSAPSHQEIFTPLFGNLHKSETTPFRSIISARDNNPTTTTTSSSSSTRTSGDDRFKKPPPESTLNCHQEHQRITASEKLNKTKKRDEKGASSTINSCGEKVVVDVACCDGPVRFHRVLNKNYGLKNLESDFRVDQQQQVDRNVLLNKVMNENIRDKQSENENRHEGGSGSGGGGSGAGDVFTCVYCNHTFKSQYCYQKHARRHLNPVNLETKSIQKVENVVSAKREVKLLDMNVQYYPCKTCGSKFPSYYFVHKHRKMCHADDVGGGGDGSVKSAEVGMEKSNTTDSITVQSVRDDADDNEDWEIEVCNDN